MPQKKHKPEEIVAKLRQVDVLLSQGRSVGEAVRSIGVTQFTYYRWAQGVRWPEGRPGEAPERARERERPAAQGGVGPDAGKADPERGCLGKLLSPARRGRCVVGALCLQGRGPASLDPAQEAERPGG
jgi:putative transposase